MFRLNSTGLTVVSALMVILGSLLVVAQQPATTQVSPITASNLTCVSSTKPTAAMAKYNVGSCIVVQLAAYLKIGENQFVELKNGKVANASRCENTTAVPEINPKIVVEFDCGSIELDIAHNNHSTYVMAISGKYLNQTSNNTVTFSDATPRFQTNQSGHYYKCNAEQTVDFAGNISLVLSQVAIEAYRNANGTDFYQIQEECPLDSQPVGDLVRIGVGVCLVALVAIVLVAYFVGRRRWSERSSYESV